MYIFLTVVILLASLLLILVVLVQDSKGGGLASGFSSSNNIMGVRKTTDIIEKMTWSLAIIVVALCIVSVAFIPTHTAKSGSEISKQVQEAAKADPNVASPFAPSATQPAEQQPQQ